MNWITFKNLVIMTAEIWEAMGYLDSSIKNPTMLIESMPLSDLLNLNATAKLKTIPSIVVSESTP